MFKDQNLIAVIDLGSASVGGAIIRLPNRESHSPKCSNLLYSVRQPINISDPVIFKNFIKGIFETLEKTLDDLADQNLPIARGFIFLASPFYVSQTKIITIKKDQPFKIKKELIDSLLIKEAESFLHQHKNLYPDLLHDSMILLDNTVMQIKLNGYETTKPYGQEAKFLFIAQYLSATSSGLDNKFKDIIKRKLRLKNVIAQSSSLAIFNILRDIVHRSNFLIIDISGELTDVMAITDGYLAENISFPAGRNFIIKGLTQKIETIAEEAYSRLKMYKNGELDKKAEEKIASVLLELKKEWLSRLIEALDKIMESVLLPNSIFIIGDDILTGIFADWLEDKNLVKFSLINQPLKTKLVNGRDFSDYCFDQSNQSADPFFQIEALFAQKIM